jgi:hypothetical protein
MNDQAKQLPALFAMSDLERMAQSMVKSRLFGIENVEQAVTLMLVAQAEGLHPATAARDYHIIQGRPSMKADAMLAKFQQAGGVVEWHDYTDTKVSGAFRHPQSPKPVMIEWTMEMAKRIGLATKDNWRKYPRAMLRARVISEGVRTCYPSIATGIYTPEEVQDFSEIKDITPTAGALGSLSAKRQEVINETAAQIREMLAKDRAWDAYGLSESIDDADEKVALWSLLDSKQRSALKRLHDAERAKEAGKISEPQKKRLEARIKELGIDREQVKRYCADHYSVSHFSDLMPDQYNELDEALESITSAAARAESPADSSPAVEPAMAADPNSMIDSEKVTAIEHHVKRREFDEAKDLCRSIVSDKLRDETAARIKKAEDYVATKARAA